MFTVLTGDAIEQLRTLPAESVHCCVTSPPYWGLRDYGTAAWEGGEAGCDHKDANQVRGNIAGTKQATNNHGEGGASFLNDCSKCGAKRIDSQLGLEKTPEEYVAKMVVVFREVRRVLRKDGTLWLNLGDSYAGGKQGNDSFGDSTSTLNNGGRNTKTGEKMPSKQRKPPEGLKPKDLCGIPWTLAKALQAPYYTGKIKSELDRVWLAATIDAEGTICGFHHERKDGDGIRTGVHIAITNTNRAMLDNAFRIWPTSKDQHNAHGKGHFGKLDIWRWIAHDVDEKSLLMREIYPHLIAKKKQCLLAYNFFELSKQSKRFGRNGEAPTTNAKRSALIHAISKLNHLEPADIPSWCVEPPSLFEDGWWLRSDIIWAKPNPMPESVTDRPTKAHEYLFLLTKSANYFYDAEAIKEQAGSNPHSAKTRNLAPGKIDNGGFDDRIWAENGNRNKRSVWTVATAPYPEAHFATYPPDLIKPCIMAGTSAKGCCAKCGAPWERVMEVTGPDGRTEIRSQTNKGKESLIGDNMFDHGTRGSFNSGGIVLDKKTLGWQPTCICNVEIYRDTIASYPHEIVPCTVLDPFAGSGTTGAVALELGRRAVLIELNPKYVALIRQRCDITPGLQLA